jgi:tight adherence protein C
MDSIYFSSSLFSFWVMGFLIVFVIAALVSMVSGEDRTFMDPLSWKMRLLWPFIQIIANYVCVHLPNEILERSEKTVSESGVGYLLTAEQFIALRFVSAIIAPLMSLLVMVLLNNYEPIWFIIMPVIGFLLPTIWLSDTRKKRNHNVVRTLPTYLDFITMCVEGGLNLQGALGQAMDKGPLGPLRNEFGIVLRDLRSGLTRAESLHRMADRLAIKEITSFVNSIVQAEKMGASLSTVLRLQADQRRDERFLRAEKMAMEAPIKLVFPLIAFIFPVTFIVLGFPIVMKFLDAGI